MSACDAATLWRVSLKSRRCVASCVSAFGLSWSPPATGPSKGAGEVTSTTTDEQRARDYLERAIEEAIRDGVPAATVYRVMRTLADRGKRG